MDARSTGPEAPAEAAGDAPTGSPRQPNPTLPDGFDELDRRVVDTARVSAMAQSIGYTLCAFGPLLVGLLHDSTGSWTGPLVLLLALIVPQAVSGALAGRNRTVRG